MQKLSILLLISIPWLLQAQDLGVDDPVVYKNQIFDPHVETVLLNKTSELTDPVPMISLNSGDQLQLTFDVLNPTNEFLQFTMIHCNSNWEPSNMTQNEYLSGNYQGNITDFKFSVPIHTKNM
jgi:hypothetical protein